MVQSFGISGFSSSFRTCVLVVVLLNQFFRGGIAVAAAVIVQRMLARAVMKQTVRWPPSARAPSRR